VPIYFFLYLCFTQKAYPMIKQFTLDSTRTLHDILFIALHHWADEMTKGQIGDLFGYGYHWGDQRVRDIYSTLKVHSATGAISKAWQLGIFTAENRAKDAAWRKQDFSHLHNPARTLHEQ
jgi:hypothetical protein